MRILITGAKGQLGSDLVAVLREDHEVIAATRADFDITDLAATTKSVARVGPDHIIHAAAFTGVDACETQPEKAFAANGLGARNVAIAARECGATLFHISTDYVFDGAKGKPYVEFDPVNPLSIYGKSKLWGETFVREQMRQHFILRTAWLYGRNGGNFVTTMLRLAGEKDEIGVVDDQRGTPTWSMDVVRQVRVLLETEAYGTYHCTAQGSCSRFELALEIFRLAGYALRPASDGAVLLMPTSKSSAFDSGSGVRNPESLSLNPAARSPDSLILNPGSSSRPMTLRPIPTSDMPRPATRPADSTLDNLMLRLQGLDVMPPWQEALGTYMKTVTSNR